VYLPVRSLRASHYVASADTFRAGGLRIVAGRAFTADDRADAPRVAVVNRHLAGRYFEHGQAVGRHLWLGGRIGGKRYRVVGVVDDAVPRGLGVGLAPREAVYLPILQHPRSAAELLVRPAGAGAAAVRRAVTTVAGVTLTVPESEAAIRARESAPLRWFARWLAVEGWAVLALAVAGVFGMMRLWVEALRPELAIRRAVGASRRRVLGYVLLRAGAAGLQGTVIAVLFLAPLLWSAVAAAFPGTRTMPLDLIGAHAAVLVAAALAGAIGPALRAVGRRIDGL
jgi:putative ABC transport system permease protein